MTAVLSSLCDCDTPSSPGDLGCEFAVQCGGQGAAVLGGNAAVAAQEGGILRLFSPSSDEFSDIVLSTSKLLSEIMQCF